MIRSSLCEYTDACILLKEAITIIVAGADAVARQVGERKKQLIFNNCVPFINFISEKNNKENDKITGIAVFMSMPNLIEYSNNVYWKSMAILEI